MARGEEAYGEAVVASDEWRVARGEEEETKRLRDRRSEGGAAVASLLTRLS